MELEIRKVPEGWEHPRDIEGNYLPILDLFYIDALEKWINEHHLWQNGTHPAQLADPEKTSECLYFAQWSGDPPDIDSCIPQKWTKDETNCFVVYETFSAGTPVSPVFNTSEEVQSWLITERNYTPEHAASLCN